MESVYGVEYLSRIKYNSLIVGAHSSMVERFPFKEKVAGPIPAGLTFIAGSSNGRTQPFGGWYFGSNPSPAAFNIYINMKVFITASYKGGENKEEIDRLCTMVRTAGFIDYCFARDEGAFDNPKAMMDKAKEEIKVCDVLLVDASENSVGRFIETGIAFSNKKKVIVIIKEGTSIKDTLRGVADVVITYKIIEDIQDDLRRVHLEWTKS